MVIIKKPKTQVNEDDIQTGNGGTNASQEIRQQQNIDQKSIQVNDKIAELLNKKLARKTQYQQDIKTIEDQLVQLAKQKADLGEDVDINMIESVRLSSKFWRKLYEATDSKSRTDEMYMIIKMSFSEIEDLSYTPSNTWCKTKARDIIGYINSNFDNDQSNNYHDQRAFLDFVMGKVCDNGEISLSRREKDLFMENFEKNLRESDMIGYILMK